MITVSSKRKLVVLGILASISMFQLSARAVSEVSNLGDLWPIPSSIGDIHALFPGGNPYGTDVAHFTTGAGSYLLNSITLEFEDDSSYPAGLNAPQWVSIQLFQKVGNTDVLLGTLGNPVVNPTPTQWPQSSHPRAYTTFIDFSAPGQIDLTGFSQYSLVIGMPADSPVDAALMFAGSAYTSSDGWSMQSTTAGNFNASGEYLKLAVDATRVPDEGNTAELLAAGIVFLGGCGISRTRFFRSVKFLS